MLWCSFIRSANGNGCRTHPGSITACGGQISAPMRAFARFFIRLMAGAEVLRYGLDPIRITRDAAFSVPDTVLRRFVLSILIFSGESCSQRYSITPPPSHSAVELSIIVCVPRKLQVRGPRVESNGTANEFSPLTKVCAFSFGEVPLYISAGTTCSLFEYRISFSNRSSVASSGVRKRSGSRAVIGTFASTPSSLRLL